MILRIAGLLIIVSTITNAARSFGPFVDFDTVRKLGIGLLVLSILISVAIPILLGLLLVYFPRTITTRVLKIEGLEAGNESNTNALQRIAFATIGLWLAVYAVIDTVYTYAKARLYFRFIEEMPSYAKPPSLSPDDFAGFVSSALQLIIGLWLVFGNRGVVNALARLRG
jgi:hypothetical protein